MPKLLPDDLHGWSVIFDLDDTLYYEAGYVASARREIIDRILRRYPSVGLTADEMLAIMDKMPAHGPGAFDALHAALPPEVAAEAKVEWMRRVYRSHVPSIKLTEEGERVLSTLKARGAVLGVITDGRVETQALKLSSLGVLRYIDAGLVSVSESVGAEKTLPRPFMRMEALTPGCTHRVYVGDNLTKDFIHPKAMGWHTVRIAHRSDSGAIFADEESNYPEVNRAEVSVDSLGQLLDVEIGDVKKNH